jgi:hypothetical protein
MPKLSCLVNFPLARKGRWHVESPIGTRIYEEYFMDKPSLTADLTVDKYSALVFVDNGIGKAESAERTFKQSLYIAVTEGVGRNLIMTPKTTVTVYPTPTVGYANKIRTVVTISAG